MTGFLYAVPLALALLAIIMGVLRSIVGAYFQHRLRLELLRKLEKNPDLVSSPGEAQELLDGMAAVPGEPQDYTLTGVILCVLGGACLLVGRAWRLGQLAAGVYWGGMICVFLGVSLALLGLLIRLLARRGLRREDKGNLA